MGRKRVEPSRPSTIIKLDGGHSVHVNHSLSVVIKSLKMAADANTNVGGAPGINFGKGGAGIIVRPHAVVALIGVDK